MSELSFLRSQTVSFFEVPEKTIEEELINLAGCICERWSVDGKLHRLDGPAVIYRNREGQIIQQEWYEGGKRHRIDAPAVVYETKYNKEEKWYRDDKLHRVGGPAIFELEKDTGRILEESWFENDQLHRFHAPAQILRETGASDKTVDDVFSVTWAVKGKFHREGGPAYIEFFSPSEGVVAEEAWYRDGLLHRDDGPARIQRHSEMPDLNIHEEWCLYGKRHRLDGPALILRNYNTAEVTHLEYFENGKKKPSPANLPHNPSI